MSDSEKLAAAFMAIISAEWHLLFLRPSSGTALEDDAGVSFLSDDDDDVVTAVSLTDFLLTPEHVADRSWVFAFSPLVSLLLNSNLLFSILDTLM